MRTALIAALLLSAADWPMSRGDAQNTAAVELEVKGAPRPWTFDGSGRVFGFEPGMTVWSSPAVAEVGGRALLAVGSYDHSVYGLDASSGELLWKFATGGPVYSAPVIWAEGGRTLVIAASSDRLVYALDAATGRQAWVHAVEDFRPTLGGARLSSPCMGTAAGQDAVFVGRWVWDRSLANPLQQGGVTALSAADGKALWKA
ncbi:MAG: outer membrane protein assembly factor BamB family protein, partial [Myxococcaceae bacterium]